MVQTAKESVENRASRMEIYGKLHDVFIEMDSEQNVSLDLFYASFSILVRQKGTGPGFFTERL